MFRRITRHHFLSLSLFSRNLAISCRVGPFPLPEEEPAIVGETPKFLVVSKPAFMLVHPAARHDGPLEVTLASWLVKQRPDCQIGLVHRLDRETSGAILVGKNSSSTGQLGRLMMRRELQKDYIGIVRGEMTSAHGVLDMPLRPAGGGAGRMESAPNGLACRTEFWRLCAGNGLSVVRLRAHTGRTHQLRAHLALAGFPILGDKQYGCDPALYGRFLAKGWDPEMHTAIGHQRHALHAWQIRFALGKVQHEYQAPLAVDLVQVLQANGIAWDHVCAATLNEE
jgi:23S rRNA pseudouridine1911/1915/1917 synthase